MAAVVVAGAAVREEVAAAATTRTTRTAEAGTLPPLAVGGVAAVLQHEAVPSSAEEVLRGGAGVEERRRRSEETLHADVRGEEPPRRSARGTRMTTTMVRFSPALNLLQTSLTSARQTSMAAPQPTPRRATARPQPPSAPSPRRAPTRAAASSAAPSRARSRAASLRGRTTKGGPSSGRRLAEAAEAGAGRPRNVARPLTWVLHLSSRLGANVAPSLMRTVPAQRQPARVNDANDNADLQCQCGLTPKLLTVSKEGVSSFSFPCRSVPS